MPRRRSTLSSTSLLATASQIGKLAECSCLKSNSWRKWKERNATSSLGSSTSLRAAVEDLRLSTPHPITLIPRYPRTHSPHRSRVPGTCYPLFLIAILGSRCKSVHKGNIRKWRIKGRPG